MGNGQMMERVQGQVPSRGRDPVAEVGGLLKRMGPEIMAALPKTTQLTPERLGRIALTTLRTTPALMQCSTQSLLGALVQCAQLGLEPDPRLGLAYLVPYGKDAQLIIGYRGLMHLARRSGEVVSIEAHVVHEADEFTVRFGMDGVLSHSPCLRGDRGKPFCVYAIARLKGGACVWDVMSVEDVERVRAKSKQRNSGPWVSDWSEMARKTVVRRLAKYLPLSVEMADAESADGSVVTGLDGGRPAFDGPVIGEVPAPVEDGPGQSHEDAAADEAWMSEDEAGVQ